jgi:hypothetical protein
MDGRTDRRMDRQAGRRSDRWMEGHRQRQGPQSSSPVGPGELSLFVFTQVCEVAIAWQPTNSVLVFACSGTDSTAVEVHYCPHGNLV